MAPQWARPLMPSLTRITGPAAALLTLAETRDYLRLDAAGSPASHPDDTLVMALIDAATTFVDGRDGYLQRALITQTWELHLDEFPPYAIPIPLPPLQAITQITYDDVHGHEQTVSPGNYVVDTVSYVGWVVPAPGVSWPATRAHGINAVRIRFIAGYGPTAEAVPSPIRQALLMLIAHWYEHREAVVMSPPPAVMPFAVEALLSPYRVWTF